MYPFRQAVLQTIYLMTTAHQHLNDIAYSTEKKREIKREGKQKR
jgi:hypothetical protein